MGMLDWLQGLVRRAQQTDRLAAPDATLPPTEPAPLDAAGPDRAELDGLDFAQAIRAHQLWKRRLLRVIDGVADEALDIATVRRDDCCDLGRWLHGEGARRHGSGATFRHLVLTHQTFHEAAADVLTVCLDGRRDTARTMVERGLYARFSVRVQGLLAQFFLESQRMAEGGAPPPDPRRPRSPL